MSESKFTPGPWVVAATDDSLIFVGRQKIASTFPVPNDDWGSANARLIASAPELHSFAAKFVRFAEASSAPINLDAALDELGDDYELTITVAHFRDLYHAARAAIAKATGQ